MWARNGVNFDVIMLREMSSELSHAMKRVVFVCSVIKVLYIYCIEINGQLFVFYRNEW
jgi:hypothetical protein